MIFERSHILLLEKQQLFETIGLELIKKTLTYLSGFHNNFHFVNALSVTFWGCLQGPSFGTFYLSLPRQSSYTINLNNRSFKLLNACRLH